jgi:hypothetical protein
MLVEIADEKAVALHTPCGALRIAVKRVERCNAAAERVPAFEYVGGCSSAVKHVNVAVGGAEERQAVKREFLGVTMSEIRGSYDPVPHVVVYVGSAYGADVAVVVYLKPSMR